MTSEAGAKRSGQQETVRTAVSAVLSIGVLGGAIFANKLGADPETFVAWGGTIIGFWFGARAAANGTPKQL